MPTPTLWPLNDTRFFWLTFQALDDSQETVDVVSALVYRVAHAAADIPQIEGIALRMLKSRRHEWQGRSYLPIRLYFAFDEPEDSVLLMIVEEDDELAVPPKAQA